MSTLTTRPRISYREFLVDFFGALMPGILFIVFLTVGFLLQIYFSFIILELGLIEKNKTELSLIEKSNLDELGITKKSSLAKLGLVSLSKLNGAPTIFYIALLLIMLMISYVIGTLFYRRDPKRPDRASFIKSAKYFKPEELKKWVVKIENEDGEINDPRLINEKNVKDKDVQYPYNNLKEYLSSRGRHDLAEKIPWTFEKTDKRSKTFINSLKIRIQFHFPREFNNIIKNEAHIRLTSTLWYVALALSRFSIWGLIFLSVSTILYAVLVNSIPSFILFGFFASFISIMFSRSARANSEAFLHYQRVREIFFVLETAKVASVEKGMDLFNFNDEGKGPISKNELIFEE